MSNENVVKPLGTVGQSETVVWELHPLKHHKNIMWRHNWVHRWVWWRRRRWWNKVVRITLKMLPFQTRRQSNEISFFTFIHSVQCVLTIAHCCGDMLWCTMTQYIIMRIVYGDVHHCGSMCNCAARVYDCPPVFHIASPRRVYNTIRRRNKVGQAKYTIAHNWHTSMSVRSSTTMGYMKYNVIGP